MNAVTSIFDARKRRYEQALDTFNRWFDYAAPGGFTAPDGPRLHKALSETTACLVNTPALTLVDVAFKVSTIWTGDTDEPTEWDLLIKAAHVDSLNALAAFDTAFAQQSLERLLFAIRNYPDPIVSWVEETSVVYAALADLQRLSA